MPACLRALASCAMVVEMATSFTLGHPTYVPTAGGYEVILLSNPNLEIKYASPTSGPNEEDEVAPKHECIEAIQQDTSPRDDACLSTIPGDQNVFVDGSCSRSNDHTYDEYAVVQLPDIVLEANPVLF